MNRHIINYIRRFAAAAGFVMVFASAVWGIYAEEPAVKVFGAGNPDMYPFEYYSDETGRYEGVMPEIYSRMAQESGYTFEYIDAGKSNRQEHLAKNRQADIISIHLKGDINSSCMKKEYEITGFSDENGENTICIGFSDIAADNIIKQVSGYLSEMTDKDMVKLISDCTIGQEYQQKDQKNKAALIILSMIAAVGLAGFLILLAKKEADKKDRIYEWQHSIGDMNYYRDCFNNINTRQLKSLYYTAYIAFDEEAVSQRYGETTETEIEELAAVYFKNSNGPEDFAATIKKGTFILLFQKNSPADAQKHIQIIMDGLRLLLVTEGKDEYRDIFHAGIYALGDDISCSSEAAIYNAKQGYLQALRTGVPYSMSTEAIVRENKQKERLHHRIAQAIREGEFDIYLQYVVDRDGSIYGAEAASRWANPQEGLLKPSRYIDSMIQTGLITEHDFYLFSLVCSQLEEWQQSGLKDLFISCNFTRQSLAEHDFISRLCDIAGRYDFDYSKAVIEITEDSFVQDDQAIRSNIKECRAAGFKVALDDIGSGYSSMQDLYRYIVDYVKIDREIVINSTEERGQMFLKGLVKFAHSMDLEVLCEGVETEEQNRAVLDAGCDFIQGYYYSRMLPKREADRFLHQRRRAGSHDVYKSWEECPH